MSSLSSVIHYGFTASAGLSGNAKLLRITDIQDGKVQWDDVPFCEIDKKGLCNYQLENDDIVIARTGGTVGKSFVISDISVVAVFASYLIRIKPIPGLYIPYIATYLESPCYWRQLSDATSGTGQPNVNGQSLSNLLVPIPPFDEQKRIIVERNSIYPHLQRYTTAQDRLDALNESLRGSLKKSVLQEAIQGRLIPQDPREEPASVLLDRIRVEKEKLLKVGKIKKKDIVDSVIYKGEDNKYYEKIDGTVLDINDEITFDIPESWSWVRLQQVCTYIHRGKSPKYSEVKEFPVIAQKCNQWDGFHIEKAQFIAPESVPSYADENLLRNKDLLWNSTGLGTLGRIGLYPASSNPYGFAVADSHVTVIRTLPEFIRPEFLLMYFSSPTVQSVIEDKASGSTKQKELATETVKSYIVPIPPLSEQDRIIDKYKTVLANWS